MAISGIIYIYNITLFYTYSPWMQKHEMTVYKQERMSSWFLVSRQLHGAPQDDRGNKLECITVS